MSVFVLNIVSMVGLGVGIDYSLLVVTRFREELNRGLGSREAAARTIATAGLAVVTSGLTVIVGFAALFVVPLSETRSVAIGGLPRAGWFPSATESGAGVRALESMGARGALQPVRVLVEAPSGQRIVGSRYLRGLRRLSDSIRADLRVSQVRSVVDLKRGTSLL